MKYIKQARNASATIEQSDIVNHRYIKASMQKKILYILSVTFMIAYFVLPQYFGIELGFDLTAQRIMILAFLFYLLEKKERRQDFWINVSATPGVIWLAVFCFVMIYTAVFRVYMQTFLYNFFEIVGLYIVAYIARNGLGVKQTIKLVNRMGMFLCILGLVEFVMRRSPFSYLETLKGLYTGAYIRAGNYRVMGPANHSLGYGLMLVVMLSLSCLDTEDDEINLFANFPYFVLIIINVFLTGSRSTIAVMGLEVIILFILSARRHKKKEILMGLTAVLVIALLVVVTWGHSFSNYIMLQLSCVFDEIFGTTYAEKFGADLEQLADSRMYREQLTKLFTVGLNPLLGRGSKPGFSWEIDGWYIKSIDNFYVATFIRYAYPGLISYMLYIVAHVFAAVKSLFKYKSGLFRCLALGIVMYFLNLWWLDGLMTYKYVYILMALLLACYDRNKKEFIPYGAEFTEKGVK